MGALRCSVSWYSCSSYGVATPLAPLVFTLTLPLVFPGSVQLLPVSISICLSQVLAEPLTGQLFQGPICKTILASAIVLGFGVWMKWMAQWGNIWMAFPLVSTPLFCPCISFRQEQFPAKKIWDGWVAISLNWEPCLSTGGGLKVLYVICCVF